MPRVIQRFARGNRLTVEAGIDSYHNVNLVFLFSSFIFVCFFDQFLCLGSLSRVCYLRVHDTHPFTHLDMRWTVDKRRIDG